MRFRPLPPPDDAEVARVAVRVGNRIRARCTLVNVEEAKGSLQITEQYAVEVEGEERPACVAECVMRLYF